MSSKFDIAFWHYAFYAPEMLWLLLFPAILLAVFIYRHVQSDGEYKIAAPISEHLTFSNTFYSVLPWLLKALSILGLVSIVIAIAKPFKPSEAENFQQRFSQGIDIVLSLDISASMLARDFRPNRISVAKKVAAEFVASRPNDRIGLVAYEGEAFTACPSTTDHNILLSALSKLEAGMLSSNGTAIGEGLGLAVSRLRSDELKSKVIILLSDGVNNTGAIDPITAAKLAKAKNVRVYTIGVGTIGMAPMPVYTPFGIRYQNVPVDVDEKTLTQIAELTGGTYFRATDEASLKKTIHTIDEMVKTKVRVTEYKTDPPLHSFPFLAFGGMLILLVWMMQRSVYKSVF